MKLPIKNIFVLEHSWDLKTTLCQRVTRNGSRAFKKRKKYSKKGNNSDILQIKIRKIT